MLKFFRKINVKDRDLSQVQDNVAQILQPLSKKALLDGVQIEATVALGSNKISHTLQRKPLGWIVVDADAAVTLYRTAWDTTFLTLTASGSATITLWVY